MTTSDRPPAWLSEVAMRTAAYYGDAQPLSGECVKTTRRAAWAGLALGAPTGGGAARHPAYAVVLHGDFPYNRFPFPDHPRPHGPIATFTVDAVTQNVFGFEVVHEVPDLSVLGRVYRLPLDPQTP